MVEGGSEAAAVGDVRAVGEEDISGDAGGSRGFGAGGGTAGQGRMGALPRRGGRERAVLRVAAAESAAGTRRQRSDDGAVGEADAAGACHQGPHLQGCCPLKY